jgi:plastin-1
VTRRPKAIDSDQPPPDLSRFKAVENTNYSVDLAKANNMSMVGIQGADIVDANKTLTLGLVWQLMRKNVVQTLASLAKGGKDITDSDIVRWANETVKKAGKNSSMRSFKDPSLRNAVFWLDLLDALKPGYVDYSLVLDGRTDEECRNNGACYPFVSRLTYKGWLAQPSWPFRLLARLELSSLWCQKTSSNFAVASS